MKSRARERPERGRVFFPVAWTKAVNDGLISEEEYLTELTCHSRAENVRTIPGIPWRNVPGDPSPWS